MDLAHLPQFNLDFLDSVDVYSNSSEDSFQFEENLSDWSVLSTPPLSESRSESPIVPGELQNGSNKPRKQLVVSKKEGLRSSGPKTRSLGASISMEIFRDSNSESPLLGEKKRKKTDDEGSSGGQKKRHRRKAQEIERQHTCPMEGCSKSYGSEGALKMHIRLKHPEDSKPKTHLKESSESPSPPPPMKERRETRSSVKKEVKPISQSTTPVNVPTPSTSRSSTPVTNILTNPMPIMTNNLLATQPRIVEHEVNLDFSGNPSDVQFLDVPILSLKLGPWQKVSKARGDLVATFSFVENKVAWEIATDRTFFKMEIPFSSLTGLDYQLLGNGILVLGLATKTVPAFYRFPITLSNSEWSPCKDFTGGYAYNAHLHIIFFPPSAFSVPFEQILRQNHHLQTLSEAGLPLTEQPEFLLGTMDPPLLAHETPRNMVGTLFSPLPPAPTFSSSLSDCAVSHRNAILTLPMDDVFTLPCPCGEQVKVKNLLNFYNCQCGFQYYYSFCLQKVVPLVSTAHCNECNKCVSLSTQGHCVDCASCLKPQCDCTNFFS